MVKMTEIKYSKKIIAFIDILGFERLVNDSRNNPEVIGRIYNTLRQSERIAQSSLKAQLKVLKVDQKNYTSRAFSDTSIICGPYDSHHDLSFITTWIMMYQFLLWREKQIFIRGAITYGDLYVDEGIIFGPALINAYHLEKDTQKAIWPRVLIDQSLLNKSTPEERKRDFLEFLKQDDENLVYLDYLREWFHQTILIDNKRVVGERKQDIGSPATFFMEHKNAIMVQVNKAAELKNQDECEEIIRKYVELSKYHNSTINLFRRVIEELLGDNGIIPDYLNDQVNTAEAKRIGYEYQPKYNAENHPEQSDMLNILGLVINRLVEKPPADILEERGIVLIGQTNIDEWGRINRMLASEIPRQLSLLDKALQESIINVDNLGINE